MPSFLFLFHFCLLPTENKQWNNRIHEQMWQLKQLSINHNYIYRCLWYVDYIYSIVYFFYAATLQLSLELISLCYTFRFGPALICPWAVWGGSLPVCTASDPGLASASPYGLFPEPWRIAWRQRWHQTSLSELFLHSVACCWTRLNLTVFKGMESKTLLDFFPTSSEVRSGKGREEGGRKIDS